jgi:predicted DNA-binding ribbon-helix-helix protein
MSLVRKHSVSIRGHKTSYSLEQPFLDELSRIAGSRDLPLAALIAEIDSQRPREANLSSAIRLYVLDWVRQERLA